jgi:hypothetical protein
VAGGRCARGRCAQCAWRACLSRKHQLRVVHGDACRRKLPADLHARTPNPGGLRGACRQPPMQRMGRMLISTDDEMNRNVRKSQSLLRASDPARPHLDADAPRRSIRTPVRCGLRLCPVAAPMHAASGRQAVRRRSIQSFVHPRTARGEVRAGAPGAGDHRCPLLAHVHVAIWRKPASVAGVSTPCGGKHGNLSPLEDMEELAVSQLCGDADSQSWPPRMVRWQWYS